MHPFRRLTIRVLVLLVLFVGVMLQQTDVAASNGDENGDRWVVVELSPIFDEPSTHSASRFERIKIGPNETDSEAIRRASQLQGALRVAVEQLFLEVGTPNDPLFESQWNLIDIGMESAWNDSTGVGIVVAVIDSGLNTGGWDTPCGGIVFPYNAITETEGIAAVVDRSGHGTHVSGTIAQCTNNGAGVAGVAYGAAIMPIKVLDLVEGGGTTATLVRGIDWAIQHNADVINISLGSSPCGATYDAIISPRLQHAVDQGITISVSAGNGASLEPKCLRYPASDLLTIAVGASTSASTVASYSDGGTGLTLIAPGGAPGGKGIRQETIDGAGGYSYQWWMGTSMAAPHVAGVAALLKSLQPSLTQSDIVSILTRTATDIGPQGWDEDSGAGILNAARATASLTSTSLPTTVIGGTSAVSSDQEDDLRVATGLDVRRLAGTNRYATAATISAASFPDGSDIAFLVTGEDFADALGIGPVAYIANGPILLTNSSSLPDVVLAELQRLSPSSIVVIGGVNAVSDAVMDTLSSLASTTRISGSSRYATAAALSEEYFDTATTVYLVTGESFPDGLAGGPLAARDGSPILLTRTNDLPSETYNEIERLGATKVVIIGGPAVVSTTVESALLAIVDTVDRISGANRFETAAAVAVRFPNPNGVTIVSGLAFPDALAATQFAAANSYPILLVGTGVIPEATLNAIETVAR